MPESFEKNAPYEINICDLMLENFRNERPLLEGAFIYRGGGTPNLACGGYFKDQVHAALDPGIANDYAIATETGYVIAVPLDRTTRFYVDFGLEFAQRMTEQTPLWSCLEDFGVTDADSFKAFMQQEDFFVLPAIDVLRSTLTPERSDYPPNLFESRIREMAAQPAEGLATLTVAEAVAALEVRYDYSIDEIEAAVRPHIAEMDRREAAGEKDWWRGQDAVRAILHKIAYETLCSSSTVLDNLHHLRKIKNTVSSEMMPGRALAYNSRPATSEEIREDMLGTVKARLGMDGRNPFCQLANRLYREDVRRFIDSHSVEAALRTPVEVSPQTGKLIQLADALGYLVGAQVEAKFRPQRGDGLLHLHMASNTLKKVGYATVQALRTAPQCAPVEALLAHARDNRIAADDLDGLVRHAVDTARTYGYQSRAATAPVGAANEDWRTDFQIAPPPSITESQAEAGRKTAAATPETFLAGLNKLFAKATVSAKTAWKPS